VRSVVLFGLLSVLIATNSAGSDLRFTGFADNYMASKFEDGSWNSMRSRLRINLTAQSGSSILFASVNGEKNHLLEEKTEVEVREIWFEYASFSWDVRIGRQIFVWGNSDGIAITDIISPGDYSEYITRDFDDIRMPVNAFQFRLLPHWGSAEVIWLPVFEPAVYPSSDSPWSAEVTVPEEDLIDAASTPEYSLRNSEVAGKVSVYSSGMDLAVSAIYTWDDTPALHRYVDNNIVHWKPIYHRTGILGAEVSFPVGEAVIRGEAAFINGHYFNDSESFDRTIEKDLVKALLGYDWYPSTNWMISMQTAANWIPEHTESMLEEKHELQATLNLSRQFLRQTLEVKNMLYLGITGEDVYDRVEASYNVTDASEISIGADIFRGTDESGFGQFESNTQAWFKVKYSF